MKSDSDDGLGNKHGQSGYDNTDSENKASIGDLFRVVPVGNDTPVGLFVDPEEDDPSKAGQERSNPDDDDPDRHGSSC